MRNNLIQIAPIIFQQLIKTYQLSLEIKISQLLLYFVPVTDRVYNVIFHTSDLYTRRRYRVCNITFQASDLYTRRRYRVCNFKIQGFVFIYSEELQGI